MSQNPIPDNFTVHHKDEQSYARVGCLKTCHGEIQTPVFMPVGTQATVKAMLPRDLHEIGSQIILGNTYHLNLRPTSELIAKMGGLHKFMNWNGPILTDSGGFQVFSLAKLRKLTEDGVHFRSHINGEKIFLGPRESLQIQANLGSDIAMVLDECPPAGCSREEAAAANKRTLDWAKISKEYWVDKGMFEQGYHVFGIVQGSTYDDMRKACAEGLQEIGFSGYAIGGVSVGEAEDELLRQVEYTAPLLPEDQARYTMGVGTPDQLLKMVGYGVDMFDCVMPSRMARHGTAFTSRGRINLKNEKFKYDESPIEEGLDNYTCNHFTKSYLRHLIVAEEILAPMLITMHNLHFFLNLMDQAREHIQAGDFSSWSADWIKRYRGEE
jgi:queuine tRNA-ribosyltransferase